MNWQINKATNLFFTVLIFSSVGFAADKKSEAPAPTPASNSDKLDVSDLEKKYWSAKDTDFSVVQNRAYTKANRWAGAIMYGPVINDTNSDGQALDLSLQYYFTERFGAELMAVTNSLKDNSAATSLSVYQGAKPDFDRTLNFYGVNFNWIPFYAKMSVMNSKILYFDMALSPGIGISTYEQQNISGNVKKTAPTFSLNVTQHFFLNNHFAIRAEVQNRWFNEDVISYRTGASLRTDFAHDSNILFGLDYFY